MASEAFDDSIFHDTIKNVDWVCATKASALPPGAAVPEYQRDKIVIGTVSRNFIVKKITESRSDGVTLYARTPPVDYVQLRATLISDIEKILATRDKKAPDAGAIICLGEMDYPAEFKTLDEKRGLYALSDEELNFRQALQTLSTDRNCLIVAGSYHDRISSCNKALLFSPRNNEAKEHAKLRPAFKLLERVRTPLNNHLRYYKTPFGNVAVLVCMDVYDLNIILGLARVTMSSDELGPIDYVLVPSYNTGQSETASEACRRLSYWTNCTVIYVNCLRALPANGIFQSGVELTGDTPFWETLGEADICSSPTRTTILDTAYKADAELKTPQTYSSLMSALILGRRDLT